MYVTFISLLIGGLMGFLQTLVRSGTITLPWGIDYYQVLTVHGVILALVLTTFFIIGFQFSLMGKTVGISQKQRKVAWISFWIMLIGTIITATMILLGKASVLYTFYAPLKAHPLFYIGLALVIVGTWFAEWLIFVSSMYGKKHIPDRSRHF
jgi:cytochrome c oxidase subunit I